MRRKLGDLELFLEACEHQVTLLRPDERCELKLDFTGLHTHNETPRLTYKFSDERILADKLLERNGAARLAKSIIQDIREIGQDDLEVDVLTPNPYSARLIKTALRRVAEDYEFAADEYRFTSAFLGSALVVGGLVIPGLQLPMRALECLIGGYMLYRFLMGHGGEERAKAGRRVKVRTIESENRRGEKAYWRYLASLDPGGAEYF